MSYIDTLPGLSTTSVFLRFKEGRSIRFGKTGDAVTAAKVKRSVEEWVRDGVTISMANALGQLEEIDLRKVVAIDIVDEQRSPDARRE